MNTSVPRSPMNGPHLTPVEYVRQLRDEEKGEVLVALLRELIELHHGGKSLIPIHTPAGESLGYFVPPAAAREAAAAALPDLSPEREAELKRRLRG